MDETAMRGIIQSQVAICVASMSDDEVLTQRLAVLLGGGRRPRPGHEALAPLYTECDGTQMHDETRRAFLVVTAERLGLGTT